MMSSASPASHEYDDPSLSAVDFLLAVMRDQTLPLAVRADAANKLLSIYRPPPQTLNIRITGGLGELTHEELVAYEARAPGDVLDWNDAKHSVLH
jgi:hypothetical protein